MKRLGTALILTLAMLLSISCEDSKVGVWTFAIGFEGIGVSPESFYKIKEYIVRKDPYFSRTHSYSERRMDAQKHASDEFFERCKALGENEISSMLSEDEDGFMRAFIAQLDSPDDTALNHEIAFTVWVKDEIIIE